MCFLIYIGERPLTMKKLVSIVLSICLFSQMALASLGESTIWEKRRQANEAQVVQKESPLLASLPAGLSAAGPLHKNLLNQLPSVQQALPKNPKWNASLQNAFGPLPEHLKEIIEALPLVYCRVQDVYHSGKKDSPSVVVLQDVHLNAEAQENIAAVLQELIDQQKADLIGVEGAFDAFDFSPFRSIPEKEVVRKVAKAFLDHKFMAAPSYVGLTSEMEPPLFLGVDDKTHHQANVEAYLTSKTKAPLIQKEIDRKKRALRETKQSTFSRPLKKFDDLRSAHHRGAIGIGSYVTKLTELIGSSDIQEDLVLDHFLEAFKMESTLDFKRVDRERQVVVRKLSKTLDEKSLAVLLAQSLSYKMGRIGFADYYGFMRGLCQENGIPLRQTPAFDNYIQYV